MEDKTLRIDVTGPCGDLWSYGPADATDTITGPAGQWCRLAVQRITRAGGEPSDVRVCAAVKYVPAPSIHSAKYSRRK